MTGESDTSPVRAAHRFDEARLAAYLAARLPGLGGPLAVRQFKAGQSNPTFLLATAERRLVLRKKPPGVLLPSAHMVEREYRVIAALKDSAVPVPDALLLCEDADIIGTPFYVMAHVEGRVVQDPDLPGLDADERAAVWESMNQTLADLHGVDWRAVGLEDFGKPGNYVARQIARWSRQYEASKTEEIAAMDRLMAWLPDHLPDGDETAIAHGDYRMGNLILHPREPRVVAVLDWELSTLGHPLSDLAYNCLPYHLPAARKNLRGLEGLDLAALGIPSEAAYLDDYCRRTGRARIEHWPFYIAFALFRLAAICQGVYDRALKGNASAPNALDYGTLARHFAEAGWAQLETR